MKPDEVSCVLEHVQGLTMAKPMIFTDDTRPSHYTFANQIGVQTDEDETEEIQVPDELRCTIVAGQPGGVLGRHPYHVYEFNNAQATSSR